MANLIEPKMRSYLAGKELTADNFYLGVATQSPTFPYGVIIKVSPGKAYSHGGTSHYLTRMQCSCYGQSYFQAKTLATEVIDEMEGWPDAEVKVESVFLTGEVDMLNEGVHHIAVDFFVFHKFDGSEDE